MTDQLDDIDAVTDSAREILRRRVRDIERARDEQPARLAAARTAAGQARAATITAEPWVDCINAVPTTDADTGELTGMLSFPSIDAKELWGTRLAYEMLDAGSDDDRAQQVLDRYFSAAGGDTGHLFLIFAAALRTVAAEIVPVMLDKLERQAGDHEMRVTLADAARFAWETRCTAGGAR